MLACVKAPRRLGCRESAEFVKAVIDLSTREGVKTLGPELLTAKASHYRPVNDRAVKLAKISVLIAQIKFTFGKIADEPTRKTVTSSGRIKDIFQKIPGNHK